MVVVPIAAFAGARGCSFLDTFVHGSASGVWRRQNPTDSAFGPIWGVTRSGTRQTRIPRAASCYPHTQVHRVGWPGAPHANRALPLSIRPLLHLREPTARALARLLGARRQGGRPGV